MMLSKRQLGKTDIHCTELALGGAGIGSTKENNFFGRPVSDAEAVDTVISALESGINLIDTSPFYGDSERKIGLALTEYQKRDSYFISTKAGTHPKLGGYDGESIRKSVENSLITLGLDYIDVLNVHDPDESQFRQSIDTGGAFEELLRLKEEGIIKYIGLGVREHDMHFRAIEEGLVESILPYLDFNVLRQDMRPLLDGASKQGIGVMLGSVLAMGYLSGKDPDELNVAHFDVTQEIDVTKATEMYYWCKDRETSVRNMNFQFCLSHPAVSTLLVGAATKEEVKENISSVLAIDGLLFEEFKEEFDLM